MFAKLKKLDLETSWECKLTLGILLLYIAYGQEVFSYSYNVDDYSQVDYPYYFGALGRYLQELFFNYALSARFVPFFAFFFGFALIAATCLIFCRTLSLKTNFSFYILLIFFGLHAGWIDALNFNTAVIGYPLAGFCSVLATFLIVRKHQLLVPAILFWASLSLYQPYAAAGFILFVALISKNIIGSKSEFFRKKKNLLVRYALAVAIGAAAYLISNEIYFVITERINSRVGYISNISEMISSIESAYRYSYDNFFPTSEYISRVSGVISFAIFIIFSGLIIKRALSQGSIATFITVLLVLVFPIVPFGAKLPITAGFPLRAQACFGLFVGACAALVFEASDWRPLAKWLPGWISSRSAVLVASVVVFISSWFVITLAFDHQSRIDREDRHVASQILHDVYLFARANNLPLDRFQIAGRRKGRFQRIGSVAQGAFERTWSARHIFRHVGFGGDQGAANISYIERPNVNCTDWPARGSIVAYQGEVLVCLSEFKNETNPDESGRSNVPEKTN